MSDVILEMRGIAKAFRGVQALDQVDLNLRRGEVHALMGENGAGKSTLIKVLTGVHAMDSGTVEFCGERIRPGSPREAEAVGISTVYQEVNLVPTLSVADNILLGRHPTRLGFVRWREVERRAVRALGRLGLKLNVDEELGAYSIAIQQMVAIARALDIDAKLLVLDEPTSSLDEREVGFLFEIMRRLKGQGLAILFVTHFLDQVYAVTDRITVLRNGKRVGEFQTKSLSRNSLVSAMLGRAFEPVTGGVAAVKEGDARRSGVLEARGLGKRGTVGPVDLELGEGETVGLAGLLGSGRTETARLLFGIDQPDSGELRWNGRSVRFGSPAEAIAHGVAFCSEDRKKEGIIPHLSVRENLVLAMQANRGALRLLRRDEQERIAEEYIRILGIKTPTAETPMEDLSGGNQQKVLLARWLALQPSVIILDEPTRGVDVGAKVEIEKLVGSLRERGMAVVFISSELEEIVRLSERVIVMRDRKKAGELGREEISEQAIMQMIARAEDGEPKGAG